VNNVLGHWKIFVKGITTGGTSVLYLQNEAGTSIHQEETMDNYPQHDAGLRALGAYSSQGEDFRQRQRRADEAWDWLVAVSRELKEDERLAAAVELTGAAWEYVTCYLCDVKGTGFISDGWDGGTDLETGENFDICPTCREE